MFFTIQAPLFSMEPEDNTTEILDAVNKIKKSFHFLCYKASSLQETETIKNIMFQISKGKLFDRSLSTITSEDLKDSLNDFLDAMKALHSLTLSKYKIMNYDLDGAISINLKYFKKDGSSYWITSDRYQKAVESQKAKPTKIKVIDDISLSPFLEDEVVKTKTTNPSPVIARTDNVSAKPPLQEEEKDFFNNQLSIDQRIANRNALEQKKAARWFW